MTKISQLTDIGSGLASGDEFVIRDVSDVGTPNKKLTANGFMDYVINQASGVGFTQIATGVGPLSRVRATSSGSTGSVIFETALSGSLVERGRIDPSGRWLFGPTLARTFTSLGVTRIQVEGTSFSEASASLTNNQGSIDGAYVVFNKSRGGSLGSNASVQSNDLLGSIWFQGTDGFNPVWSATIAALVDATPGSGVVPGRLSFYTAPSGNSPQERLRIDNLGKIALGSAAPLSLLDLGNSTSGSRQISWHSDSTTSYGHIWTGFSGGGLTLGHGLRGSATVSNGYESSTSSVWGRSAIEQYNGEINFYTIPSSGIPYGTPVTPLQRLQINPNGRALFSHSDNDNVIIANSTAPSGYSERLTSMLFAGYAPNNTSARFIYCADTAATRAEIRSNGGLANFQANDVNLSDRNAKKDISPAANTWNCLKEWEIVNYRYKDQPDDANPNLGVIAQQVAESCPEVVTIFQEAVEATEDELAKEERLGVKEQQMYWMAIKALQEAQVRIETLEARLTAAGIE